MLRILIAPDKFKDTLAAPEVAAALAAGLREALPDAETIECPLADGGEGSHQAALHAGFVEVGIRVADANGVPRETSYARHGSTAVLELARICGSPTLAHGPDPWNATTIGLGEGMRCAIRDGASDIVLCLGGSASIDGGSGMLRGLGYRLLDGAGGVVAASLAGLAQVARVEPPSEALQAHITIACDVSHPLLGGNGGVRVFSAQKGLTPDDIEQAEVRMRQWALLTHRSMCGSAHRLPGAGAAGGVGFAALAWLDAEYMPGLDYFDRLTGLTRHIALADVVVTGEGAFDRGSLGGKAAVGVARRAADAGRPCLLVAGRIDVDATERDALFRQCWSVAQQVGLAASMAHPAESLRSVGAMVGRTLQAGL